MLLRVVLSAALACGIAAASDRHFNLLDSSRNSLQACTQNALQNAINAERQKQISKGAVDYYQVQGDSQTRKIIVHARAEMPACSIPLTEAHPSPDTRYELNKMHPGNENLDSTINLPGLPVCR